MYLLDTCVISDFIKGEEGTLSQIKSHSPAELAISSITMMEIDYGLLLNPNKAKKIRPIIDELLNSDLAPCPKWAGEGKAEGRRQKAEGIKLRLTVFKLICFSSFVKYFCTGARSQLKPITIVNFGVKEAELAAEIRVFLKKNGTPIGAYDVLIGATAWASNLILVTANTKEFERIPDLQVINWRL